MKLNAVKHQEKCQDLDMVCSVCSLKSIANQKKKLPIEKIICYSCSHTNLLFLQKKILFK